MGIIYRRGSLKYLRSGSLSDNLFNKLFVLIIISLRLVFISLIIPIEKSMPIFLLGYIKTWFKLLQEIKLL